MPRMSVGAIDLSNYFSSLTAGSSSAAFDDDPPMFTLADAPYSPTNAATTPTKDLTSPYTALKQWSLDQQVQPSVQTKQAGLTQQQQMILIGAAVLVLVLMMRHR